MFQNSNKALRTASPRWLATSSQTVACQAHAKNPIHISVARKGGSSMGWLARPYRLQQVRSAMVVASLCPDEPLVALGRTLGS